MPGELSTEMMKNLRGLWAVLVVLCCLVSVAESSGQVGTDADAQSSAGATIVSSTHPKDSRGEVVYTTRGPGEEGYPVVAGKLVPPVPLKIPKPKYPHSLKAAHGEATVTVQGVVTANGDVIDAATLGDPEPEVAEAALHAVSQYRFHPATLDGKAVAILLNVVVNFRWRPS